MILSVIGRVARSVRPVGGLLLVVCLTSSCAAQRPLPNGELIQIGNTIFRVQSPSSEEGDAGVSLGDDGSLRFETAPGLQWQQDKARGRGAERAEISSQRTILFGEKTSIAFRMRVLSGRPTERRAVGLVQLHGPNRSELPEGRIFGRPALSFGATTDGFAFFARSGSIEIGERSTVELVSVPLEFGRWCDYRIEVTLGDEEFGAVDIWRDGELIAAYDGPVGYDVGRGRHYWKLGVYRYRGIGEASVVDYEDIEIDGEGKDLFVVRDERDGTP